MTTDFQILVETKVNPATLVTAMYEKYKNYIYKKGIAYSSSFKSKFEVEDYVSDVYLKLYWYANYINLEKADENRFSFFIYVRNACCDTLASYVKRYRGEAFSLDDETKTNNFSCCDDPIYQLNFQKFLSRLTPYQQQIYQLKDEGRTTVQIQKDLNTTYFLVSKALKQMKELYTEIFEG